MKTMTKEQFENCKIFNLSLVGLGLPAKYIQNHFVLVDGKRKLFPDVSAAGIKWMKKNP